MASLEPGGVLSSQGNSRDSTNRRRDIQLDRGHPGPRTGSAAGTGNWSCVRELVKLMMTPVGGTGSGEVTHYYRLFLYKLHLVPTSKTGRLLAVSHGADVQDEQTLQEGPTHWCLYLHPLLQ